MSKKPSFWDPKRVGIHRNPDLGLAFSEGKAAGLKPASEDTIKTIAVGIDFQNDFVRDDGTLKVEGAVADVRRFIEYLYGNAEDISALLFSFDQHLPWMIFYPGWWKDRNGNHPTPFAVITEDDVMNTVWIPQLEKKWSLDYPTRLRETDQSPLLIWPFHCMIGTEGADLLADLAEAIMWLSAARNIQPLYMFKGTVPGSEHYGPFCCCVPVPNHPQGGLQTQFMDVIATNDRIIFAGEAEDFCVREAMRQLLSYYGNNSPDIIKKIQFLKDCTSPVYPGKRDEADNILDDFAVKGVQIVNSTD